MHADVPEKTDTGFSEKRAARIMEGKQHDNSQVKKTLPAGRQGKLMAVKQKIIQQIARRDIVKSARQVNQSTRVRAIVSIREKILAAFDNNEKQLHELVHTLEGLDVVRATEVFQKIVTKQTVQKELLTLLVLEQKGETPEDVLSKQLANLVK